MPPPGNFTFLASHSPLFATLGATAERLFPFDPASGVLKLRLLAEALTQDMAARLGLQLVQPTQAELLRAVDARLNLDAQVRQLFHLLRRTGNTAAHEAVHGIGFREGLDALKVARELAVWFHRTFGADPAFKPGPFVLPDDPSQRLATARTAVDRMTPSLLAKAFRGELVPQDPVDEPAAELLARLAATRASTATPKARRARHGEPA